jgi:hypothetical protein
MMFHTEESTLTNGKQVNTVNTIDVNATGRSMLDVEFNGMTLTLNSNDAYALAQSILKTIGRSCH